MFWHTLKVAWRPSRSLTDEDKLWITERLGVLTHSVDGPSRRVDGLKQQVDAIDRRLEFLGSAFTSIDSRLPALNKALVDFSALAGQLTQEQWRSKDVTTDLAGRTTRLEDRISKLVNLAA